MRFIKHALLGIALYEAIKYLLKKDDLEYTYGSTEVQAAPASPRRVRNEQADVIKGARQTGSLDRMKVKAAAEHVPVIDSPDLAPDPLRTGMPHVGEDLNAGNDPEAALTGQDSEKDKDDPWKNSLADDDLRAPDS